MFCNSYIFHITYTHWHYEQHYVDLIVYLYPLQSVQFSNHVLSINIFKTTTLYVFNVWKKNKRYMSHTFSHAKWHLKSHTGNMRYWCDFSQQHITQGNRNIKSIDFLQVFAISGQFFFPFSIGTHPGQDIISLCFDRYFFCTHIWKVEKKTFGFGCIYICG